MGGALAVRSFRVDKPSSLAAVLPLHARGPRALSLVCFNMTEPGEEGPMGSGGAAPKPAGLVDAVKAIPNLGFMEGPFVALAEKFEGALTAALSGKATSDDVKAAVKDAVDALRTELTRALKATSDSAAQRMGAVEEKVGVVEASIHDVAETLQLVSEATNKTAKALEQINTLVTALQKVLEEGLAGKASPDDVKAAVKDAVDALRIELTRALKATSDSAAQRMGAVEERVEAAASAAAQAQSTAEERATPGMVAEAVSAAVSAATQPLADRVTALEAANAELRRELAVAKSDLLEQLGEALNKAGARLLGAAEKAKPKEEGAKD